MAQAAGAQTPLELACTSGAEINHCDWGEEYGLEQVVELLLKAGQIRMAAPSPDGSSGRRWRGLSTVGAKVQASQE